MILSKVPSNDGEACPVAAGGCTVHTGRTLHYTGAVLSLSFCQLLLCRTRERMQIYRTSPASGPSGLLDFIIFHALRAIKPCDVH